MVLNMQEFSCKVSKRCGGCQLSNMSYAEQLIFKQKQVERLLSSFGKVNKIIGAENPFNYRNKVQAAFYYDFRRRKTASGVYQSNSQSIVPVDSCMLENKTADKIIVTVRKLCDSFKIKPYDIKNDTGVLRHVLVRCGNKSGEIMVVLVTAVPNFPSKNNFVKALLKAHPEITTVVHNVNNTELNLALGAQSRTLYGKGYIEDELCGCKFRISPDSFYQVNPVQCEMLYSKAVEFASLTGKETLFDSYCGTGTIGIIAARKAKQVLGVELNKSAVKDAIANAKLNGVKNIYFTCDDAGEYLEYITGEGERFDVVMMDPPRAGADVKFLNSVIKAEPKRIVYVSCNPSTLARDLEYITKKGYAVRKIQPVDMFPYTRHMETVVLMTKKQTDMDLRG